MTIEQRLNALNIQLPEFNFPAGSYVAYKLVDDLVYVAGQTTRVEGQVQYAGRLGDEFTVEQGQEAARLCIKNVLCQVKQACSGDLDRVVSVLKLNVFVQSGPEFTEHAKVADGASDLLCDIFGDKGKHIRTSTGAISLPANSAVEIDAIFQVVFP